MQQHDSNREASSLFHLDLAQLASIPIDEILSQSDAPTCECYFSPLARAVTTARASADEHSASVYELLCELVCLHPQFDTPECPFAPRIICRGQRSIRVEDLPELDLRAIRELAGLLNNSALAARLFDLSWVVNMKDHQACALAAEHYLKAAQVLIELTPHWIYAPSLLKRAAYLAGKLGRSKPLYTTVVNAIATMAVAADNEGSSVKLYRLLQILQKAPHNDQGRLLEMSWRNAENRGNCKDYEMARSLYTLAIDWLKRLKDKEREKEAQLRIAAAFINEAENCPDLFTRANFLKRGIEAYCRAGHERSAVAALKQRLTDVQEDAAKTMVSVALPIPTNDFQEMEPAIRSHVKRERLQDAVFCLATIQPLIKVDQLRASVQAQIARFHFAHMFGKVMVDQRGRTIQVRRGALGSAEADRAKELEQEMFQSACIQWNLRAAYFIEPARSQVEMDHQPTLDDLAFLVDSNPCIPAGHEMIILRGIHAGFHGDFMVACHFLIPQIENMMRYALEHRGVNVTNMEQDGTQPVKIFGGIFNLPETMEVFGESLCFELRGHLIEKSGFDFRNRLAHGFALDYDFVSTHAVSCWWLALYMVFFPLIPRLAQRDGAEVNDGGQPDHSG